MIEKSLQQFADKIQWLVNNDKISQAQLQEYNQIIQDIQFDFNVSVDMINELNCAVARQRDQILNFKIQIQHLEAICLLHGITDLQLWMQKPRGLILNLLNDSQIDGWKQLPASFKDFYSFPDNFYLPKA